MIAIENRIRTLMDKSENTGKSAFTPDSVIVIIFGCQSGAALKEQHTNKCSFDLLNLMI